MNMNMKYIKRFNEELNPQTYRNAARRLDKIGKHTRSADLINWADKVEIDNNLQKWNDMVDRFQKFGKFKISLTNRSNSPFYKITGDFYLLLDMNRDAFGDSLDDIKSDGEGEFWIGIGIIPADIETLNKCIEMLPDPDLGNGFFWAMFLQLNFTLNAGELKMTTWELLNYDENISGKVSFADRGSANRFKMLLVKIFSDPNFDYPSGYNDFDSFYTMFDAIFCINYGMSSLYGLEPETVANFIRQISPNEMYSE